MFKVEWRFVRPLLPLLLLLPVAGACGTPAVPPARPAILAATAASVAVHPAAALASPTPAPAPIPVSADAIANGNAALPEVALDFNVGAGFDPAMQVLQILLSRHVPASFFVMGWLATAHPETVAAIAKAGFEIGSHGDRIADVTQASDAAIVADLGAADDAIRAITRVSTRPLWSPSAGYQDARVRGVAAGIGYDTILWSVDAGDWRTDATAAAVEDAVLPALKPGAIVVMHFDSTQSDTATVAALPVILDALRARGLTPVPVSTLLRHLGAHT